MALDHIGYYLVRKTGKINISLIPSNKKKNISIFFYKTNIRNSNANKTLITVLNYFKRHHWLVVFVCV